MRHTRIAAFVLGAWLLGTLFMIFVATQNFETVDRVLKNPPLEAYRLILALGNDGARQLLRYKPPAKKIVTSLKTGNWRRLSWAFC